MVDWTLLKKGCERLEIPIDNQKLARLYDYYQLVIDYNRNVNLTAITEWEVFEVKHFLDSLAVVAAEPAVLKEEWNLIDVGTGAGFPGMVLKIVFPQLQVTLLDSLKKRIRFLDEVTHRLGLVGVNTIHGRAEDCGHDEMLREKFDLSVSRAVADFSMLAEFAMPFVKTGGSFIAYKSEGSTDEIVTGYYAAEVLGGAPPKIVRVGIPGSEIARNLVVTEKVSETPDRYPRKPGKIKKKPL